MSSIAAPHSLDADYQRAGFGATLPFGRRPALIVVDVVQAYVQPGSGLYAQGFVDALAPNRRIVAAARAAGVPVIFTRVAYDAQGRDGGLFFRKVPALRAFTPGSPLGAWADGLAPLHSETVVTKQYASAFFGTTLASTLTACGIDTAVITGFSTSGCVRATALDALQHGFAPFVVRDACGERDARPQEANLFDLQAKYAEVISEAQAIEQLSRSAGAAMGADAWPR
ncbi:isochorismatase family protein [Aquabacterium sp. OR-4]|uniref:isochorismatase family protein n=1 Tax=Aquabacterium sp. OR-4 TaxID=2978127 RepID=UPI0021B28FB3|nr:isochorismatase family protein [Aquabacterium sp. OR-4]MDT7836951.1 isochorismatase family protein [Aquabacterium sp. OR-4]